MTIGEKGIRKTVGISGIGLSDSDYQKYGESTGTSLEAAKPHGGSFVGFLVGVFFLIFLYSVR